MKRKILIVVMLLLVLSGCSSPKSSNKESEYYKFNHTGITEINGTSQMSENVKKYSYSERKTSRTSEQNRSIMFNSYS